MMKRLPAAMLLMHPIWFVNNDGSINGKGNRQGTGAAFKLEYQIRNGKVVLKDVSPQ